MIVRWTEFIRMSAFPQPMGCGLGLSAVGCLLAVGATVTLMWSVDISAGAVLRDMRIVWEWSCSYGEIGPHQAYDAEEHPQGSGYGWKPGCPLFAILHKASRISSTCSRRSLKRDSESINWITLTYYPTWNTFQKRLLILSAISFTFIYVKCEDFRISL